MPSKLPPTYLSPGQNVVIEAKRGDVAVKGVCKVLGSRDPCYVLTEMPLVGNKPVLAPADTWCVVRALSKGKAIGFRARIEKIHVDHPFPIVILACPAEFQEVTVRKAVRISCDVPATLLASPSPTAKAAPAGEQKAAPEQQKPEQKEGGAAAPSPAAPAAEAQKAPDPAPATATAATEAAPPPEQPPATAPTASPADPALVTPAVLIELVPAAPPISAAPAKANRHRPDGPFAAIIIDLSEGGCQVAVPSIHPDVPSELPPEVLRQVRAERRLHHHPETLKEAFQAGDICAVQMDLPLQESPVAHEAVGEIRWAKVFHHYHLFGVMFTQAPPVLITQIRKVIDFHAKFFTPPFEPL